MIAATLARDDQPAVMSAVLQVMLRELAMLSLHFIPENERAVAEMCRVTRPGGVVAGAVWARRQGGRRFGTRSARLA